MSPVKDLLRGLDRVREKQRREAMTKVTNKVCFSEECWWISGRIRCRGCPYIDPTGFIKHPRIREIAAKVETRYHEA